MPHNPFTQPDFWYVAGTIAGLLLLGLAGVALAERRRLRELTRTTLFLRVRSWAIIAPIFVLTLYTGGFLVFLLAAFIALQAASEYGRLVGLERRYAWMLTFWVLAGLLVAAFSRTHFLFLPLVFFVLLTLIPILSGQVEDAHRQVANTMYGYLYVGLPIAYLVYIGAAEPWGREFLLIVGLAIALSDVGAFVAGSALKGPRLAPAVSPNKTISGVGGNILGAGLGVLALAGIIPLSWSVASVVALILIVGVAAVWGDLAESFLKRDFAVKDAGRMLPGFGGILDRVDSLLFALPLGYYGVLIVNGMTA